MLNEIKLDPASFRDPAAHVFVSADTVIREIYPPYFADYDLFMEKVYPDLVNLKLIVPHKLLSRDQYRIIIAPEIVPFISYPYEWSFQTLKAAALTTLRINRIALTQGMMLKDASAYNIQFYQERLRLIDTTSFIKHEAGQPWPAYSQFLRHFLCPLLLGKYVNTREMKLSEIYLDGIPVPYTANRLPLGCKFNAEIWTHIYSQSLAALFKEKPGKKVNMSATALDVLLDNLYHLIENLKYRPVSAWLKYSEAGSYSANSLKSKKEIIEDYLQEFISFTCLDLGSNTGDYSRLAAKIGLDVIAVDSDHDCIYDLAGQPSILPLVVDLCNPSPGIGWNNQERRSFWDRIKRVKVDVIMALALIHHLSIRNNVPLDMVASLLADHCNYLIIEWVPLEDKQAQRLLGTKRIPEYNHEAFIAAFSRYFNLGRNYKIYGSGRVVYQMERKINGN